MKNDMPWTQVWIALQEIGAALDYAGDLPNWAQELGAAIIEAEPHAKEAALTEAPNIDLPPPPAQDGGDVR
jgi:hypothetical protein